MPTIADSEMGVSMTRDSPNSWKRPWVTPNAPPYAPTSSPSTNTFGSRRISSRSASRMASRYESSLLISTANQHKGHEGALRIYVTRRIFAHRILRIHRQLHGCVDHLRDATLDALQLV